jgi:hypothetical protein
MRPSSPSSRTCRLAASILAATGLLGHGFAMLLVAFLTPAAVETGSPGYGEICTADGLVSTAREPGKDQPAPGHPAGHIEACPICTAFTQSAQADLPPALVLPAPGRRAAAQRPPHELLRAAAGGFRPLSRGPPAVA